MAERYTDPPADIYWEKNFNERTISNDTTIDGIPTKVLSIKQKDNITNYTCKASNIAGIANRTVNIRTLSKPTCIYIQTSVLIIICIHVSFPQLSTAPIIQAPHRIG